MKMIQHPGLQQRPTITQNLKLAIHMLQLSNQELQQEIQALLDSNMMLELAEGEFAGTDDTMAEVSLPAMENEYRELADPETLADIPQELAIDSAWDDIYDTQTTISTAADSDNDSTLAQSASSQTLQDHLLWQMELTPFSERDRVIATAIIDAINDNGYLTTGIEEIYQGITNDLEHLEIDEVMAVLHRVQNFDPSGVAAIDLADCLRIQVQQLPDDTPWKNKALVLVNSYLEVLAKNDLPRLKRLLAIDDDELRQVITLIRTLDPKPGRRIAPEECQPLVPELLVTRQGRDWVVRLNPESTPKLRINPSYSKMIRRADRSSDNVTMRNHLQDARFFISSLKRRGETLLKVGNAIVQRQKDFLNYGETAMKPLVLRDIANSIGMHESTVSRVTSQKYIHTPTGLYELKYFFSSHVGTDKEGEYSATAVKAYVKAIIDQENSAKPYSDDSIATQLKTRGIKVARRTVTKYREILAIPSSNERRRCF